MRDDNYIMKKLITDNEYLRTALIVFFCIIANSAGNAIATRLQLPMWLDSFGTIFAAYTLGPVCGVIVGVTGNAVSAITDPTALAYAVTSVFIGLSVGYMAKKKYFENIFLAMSVAGVVTIVSVLISAVLNAIFYKGTVGNIWGDGVREFLVTRGVPNFISMLIGQFYLDFLDKLVTVLAMYLLIKIRRKRRDGMKDHGGLSVFLPVLLAAVIVCTFTAGNDVKADETVSSRVQVIYTSDTGLPCGHANDIVQTQDGVLWIGTYAGLYRYSGSEFRMMDNYSSVRNVNCLYVDEEGRLWIGTNDNGVVIAINEKIANALGSGDGLPADSVRCITQSADGDYYIGTSDSTAVISSKVGMSVITDIPTVNYAYKISADKTGYVAAVTADGRLCLMKDRAAAGTLEPDEGRDIFTAVRFAESGLLYVGTSEGKIHIYNISGGDFERVSSIQCGGLLNINDIYLNDDKSLYVCADNGVGTVSRTGVFSTIKTGDFNGSIDNMEVDYQGNLWFTSSRHGVMKLSPSPFTDLYSSMGLDADVVNTTAVWHDRLYVGKDNGLDIIDLRSYMKADDALYELLEKTRIRCIMTDSYNRMWICTYGKGLIEVDSVGNIKQYDPQEGNIGNRVRVCIELSDGSVAVGGENGISFIRSGIVAESIPYGDELGFAKVLCMWESPDGTLYAGTDGSGIAVIKNGAVEKHITRADGLSSGVILRIVPDKNGRNVFIVTSNGLCYMDQQGARLIENFPYNNNYDLFLNDSGVMFVLGSAGIYVCRTDELLNGGKPSCIVLDIKKGLLGALTANAYNGHDDNKNVYLSTNRGVFVLNTDKYTPDRATSRIKVSKIAVDGVTYPIARGSSFLISREAEKIELFPEIIDYTLEDPTISYYLEGVETSDNVMHQSDLASVTYTNLPSGDYVFHLAVIDKTTGRIIEESQYPLTKEKSIYENRWFMFYMLFVGTIFIGWLTWFITRTYFETTIKIQKERLQLAMNRLRMENATIIAIAKTVDAKDVRTSKHSQRVSEYSVMIAREIGFSESDQENLRRAALLHDIGKIGIPDSILNKPAKLTDEEYSIMKTHVTKGAEILKDVTMIDHVVDGARYHHERYDGRGYPEGLSGGDIPLYGRIIAVADAFDAMTSNRVYRKKLDFDFVIGELKRCRGTQFDPVLLDAFMAIIERGEISEKTLYEAAERERGEIKDDTNT